MADQHRKDYVDDYRPQGGRGWPERASQEARTPFGDDEARWRRQQDDRDSSKQYGGDRGWRDQGDARDDRGGETWRGGYDRGQYGAGGQYAQGGERYGRTPSGREQFGQGQYAQGQHGPYSGGQYSGPSPYDGGGAPDHDFTPHRVGSSNRESERQYGSGGDWRTSESSFRDQGRTGGGSWGSAGSYGRSQGAGSFGGSRPWHGDRDASGFYNSGSGPDWDTGGGYGGGTSFIEPRGWGGGATGGSNQIESYSGRGPKGYTRSDDRIREDVSDRLEQDHGVDASDISVQVLNGEVMLTGTVSTRIQKRRAEDCVETVSGVKEVTNNLRVSRLGQPQAQAQAPSESSSSILGLGGQQSRDSSDSPPGNGKAGPRQEDATTPKSSPGTPGSSPSLSA